MLLFERRNKQLGNKHMKKRILIIDDDKSVADTIKMILEETGEYEVGVESESLRAMASVEKFNPHLILLDIVMPKKDGFSVLRDLKKNSKTLSIPVIMLTALGGEESRIEASELYSEDYIVKSTSVKEIRAKIASVMDRHPF